MWCPCGTDWKFLGLSFCAPVLRRGMPCLRLKDCHVAALLAMTRNCNVLFWKTDVFEWMQTFSMQINAPFSSKTDQLCHCEEGAFLRPTRQSLRNETASRNVARRRENGSEATRRYTASRPHDRRSRLAAKHRLRFVPMSIFAENTKENRAFFARL